MRTSALPAPFATALDSLMSADVRAEVQVEHMRPPQRLAPWTHALALRIVHGDGTELATGRLVVLYDPEGQDAWHGELRLVGYASAELDPEMIRDPLLPEVGWSWLLDALAECDAEHTAAGGTVTQTASTRFGDLAGPVSSCDVEVRASWTPLSTDLGPHLRAWAQLMATAAGLPPPGVAILPGRLDQAT